MKPMLWIGLSITFACAPSVYAEGLPGVWLETENRAGHVASKPVNGASGGKLVAWFAKGKSLHLGFQIDEDLAKAMVHLRYARGARGGGQVQALLGPASAAKLTDDGVRPLGTLSLSNTGGWDRFAWASLPTGPLAPGRHRLFLACQSEVGAGDLDLVGITPDKHDGLWQPPNEVRDGKLAGEGTLLPPRMWDFEPEAYRGVFTEGEPVAYRILIRNRSTAAQEAKLRWRLADFEQRPLGRGQLSCSLKPQEAFERRTLQNSGHTAL